MLSLTRPLLALAGVLLLAACTTTPPEPADEQAPDLAGEADQVAEAPVPEPPAPEDYPVAPFSGDSLYQLLVGEIAGHRAEYDTALEHYLAASYETRDPAVAERATRLALFMKNDLAAMSAATIWAEEDPDNIDAHRHLSDLLLRAGRLDQAIVHMETVRNLGGLAKFDVFAYRASNLPTEQQASLLEAVTEMLERYPGDTELMFSKAVLLELTGDYEGSLALAEALLSLSDDPNVIVLKMSTLASLERNEEALAFMTGKVEAFPENRRLRLILARMLFEAGDLPAAKAQYQEVLVGYPNDADVLFALALIALENEDDAEAREHLERMVRWNLRVGEARYYLGGIAERDGDSQKALSEYRQAGTGYEFLPAQSRIASILFTDGRIEEAREHLARTKTNFPSRKRQLDIIEVQLLAERGLEPEALDLLDTMVAENPGDIETLYFRAMTGQRFDRLDILEADLRSVIELDPENADALNALGYTLADQTDRYEEARELIERAIEIKPEEPAFIDSLGWVHYRLGNYEEAVRQLRLALSLFQNDEIAAHLGEVLWVMGEQDEANQVWDEALELTPESEILLETIQRLRGL